MPAARPAWIGAEERERERERGKAWPNVAASASQLTCIAGSEAGGWPAAELRKGPPTLLSVRRRAVAVLDQDAHVVHVLVELHRVLHACEGANSERVSARDMTRGVRSRARPWPEGGSGAMCGAAAAGRLFPRVLRADGAEGVEVLPLPRLGLGRLELASEARTTRLEPAQRDLHVHVREGGWEGGGGGRGGCMGGVKEEARHSAEGCQGGGGGGISPERCQLGRVQRRLRLLDTLRLHLRRTRRRRGRRRRGGRPCRVVVLAALASPLALLLAVVDFGGGVGAWALLWRRLGATAAANESIDEARRGLSLGLASAKESSGRVCVVTERVVAKERTCRHRHRRRRRRRLLRGRP